MKNFETQQQAQKRLGKFLDKAKTETQQQAKKLLDSFLAQKKLSKVKLANKIGISHAVLTYVTNEQWEHVSDEMLLKIINALKAEADNYKLITTANYNTVLNVCKDTQSRGIVCGIIGYTGAGKTTALKKYYQSNSNVYYVACKNIMNRKQFFAAILKEMGINFIGTVYDMVSRIIDEFNSKESPLLIIDEAGKLSHTLILDLHDLTNETYSHLGIVLAGCEYFKENLESSVEKNKQGIPEFYRRVVSWQFLELPTRKEVEAIYNVNGLTTESIEKRRFANFGEVFNEITQQKIVLDQAI